MKILIIGKRINKNWECRNKNRQCSNKIKGSQQFIIESAVIVNVLGMQQSIIENPSTNRWECRKKLSRMQQQKYNGNRQLSIGKAAINISFKCSDKI